MPSVDYLRELSLIKKGYSPSEAKKVVDSEVINRFQNQSTAVRDSYSKYYSSVLSNTGTQSTQTIGAQQSIAAPAVDPNQAGMTDYFWGKTSSPTLPSIAEPSVSQGEMKPITLLTETQDAIGKSAFVKYMSEGMQAKGKGVETKNQILKLDNFKLTLARLI